MGAWNYPIQLSLQPLTGAIASGNCAVIKPSELAPASADVMAKLIAKYAYSEIHRYLFMAETIF
jgi:aldehyde dehydrogenase (NAD+)